jgi:hypothetical protein
MDIKQLTPDALTALAERIHYAQCLLRFEDDTLVVNLKDRTGQVLSLDQVRDHLTALTDDMRSTADWIDAAVEGLDAPWKRTSV